MVYVGLDLHKRYITACALDASGVLLAESCAMNEPYATSRVMERQSTEDSR